MRWRENKLISLKLRNGKYVLLQWLSSSTYVSVFNIYSNDDVWTDIILNEQDILFTVAFVSKSVLKNSTVREVTEIEPLKNVNIPQKWINVGEGFTKHDLWTGTEDEVSVLVTGEGNNLLVEWDNNPSEKSYKLLNIAEYEKVKNIELENLHIYPEFNERILLCSELNMNVNPLKDIAFSRKLSAEYKTYLKIISGKALLADLGY